MEEHAKLVTISDKSLSYRLVKYTFNIEGKIFKNLCPYFWLVVASWFCVSFVFITRVLIDLFQTISDMLYDYTEKMYRKEYENFVRNMSEEDLLFYIKYMNQYGYSDCIKNRIENVNFTKKIPSHIIEYERNHYSIAEDWSRLHGKNPNKLAKKQLKFTDGKLEEYIKVNNLNKSVKPVKVKEVKTKTEEQKAKAQKIIQNCKAIGGGVITVILLTLTFGIVAILTNLLTLLIQFIILNPTFCLEGLIITGIILVLLCVAFILGLLLKPIWEVGFDNVKNNAFELLKWYDYILTVPLYFIYVIIFSILKFFTYTLFYNFLWKKIIVSTWDGIVTTIRSCGGIFGEYFGASYSDYCPGIEWEEEKEGK